MLRLQSMLGVARRRIAFTTTTTTATTTRPHLLLPLPRRVVRGTRCVGIQPTLPPAALTIRNFATTPQHDDSTILQLDDEKQPTSTLSAAYTTNTTQRPLSSTSSPLGSLTELEWDHALAALATHVEKALANMVDEQQQQTGGAAIYWINAADKLLARLQAELATKSTASRTRGDDVLAGQVAVLEAWCQMGRQQPDNKLATERGTRLFWNIVQRRQGQNTNKSWWKALSNDNDDSNAANNHNSNNHKMAQSLVHSLLDLLEIYVRKENLSNKDLEQATSLLLWKDLPALSLDEQEIGPMYGILTQQVQFLEDEKLLALLLAQWERISNQNIEEWFLQVEEEEDDDDESLLLDHDAQSAAPLLSSFETERMVQQTVTLLQRTDSAYRDKIEKVIGQWEHLISSGATHPNAVVNVILDYYARSGDTVNAIKWLARLDLTNSSDLPKGLNQLLISLAEKDDPSAIWRAEEILRQLEASGGQNALDPAAYAAVAERWLKTNESQAYRRVVELCFRPEKFDARLVSVLLRGIRRERKVSAEMVNQILEWYTKQDNDSLETNARRDLVEGLLFVLRRHGQDWQGWELFCSEMENGLAVDEKLCELAVASIPNSAKADDVMKVFQFLESKKIELGIGFFLEASKRLADLRNAERLDKLIALYHAVLDRLRVGTIDPKDAALSSFFASVFELVNYWKRDDIALDLLNQIEAPMACQLPISCFSSTANTLSFKGKVKPVKDLYQRLTDFYIAGHDKLHPDAKFYLNYVRVLSTESVANSSKIDAVFKKQLSLLEEQKDHYKLTENTEYKPLPGMYKTLLSTATKLKPTKATAALSEALLNEMIVMDAVDTKDPDPFTKTMHIILQSQATDEFKVVSNILEKMQTLSVQQSDLSIVNALRACTRTRGNDQREDGLKLTMGAVSKFRRLNNASVSPHGARVYSLALASIFRNFRKNDTRIFPIVSQVFEYCCVDGYVTPQIVQQIQETDKLSKFYSQKIYDGQLLFGGREPSEWSRNIPNACKHGH